MVDATIIELTRFTKSGGPLTKQISLAADGSLLKDGSACVMSRGTAERIKVASIEELGDLIEGLTSEQALALGALRAGLPGRTEIVAKAFNGETRPDLISRTNANIVYGGPAFVLLDFDSKAMPAGVAIDFHRAGGFWPTMVMVLPALGQAARLIRASTSSGLSRSDTGEQLPGSDGMHVYIAVKDGTDAERFLTTLHQRCWLNGFGWMMAGAGGAALERSIVDRMVGGAERLVFEGAPVLLPPLVQDAESRRPITTSGVLLDTVAVCPPLTGVEQARFNELKARERERMAPQLAKARSIFVKTQTEKLATRTGLSHQAARTVILRQCEGVLRPDVELPFDDPELAGCTVADVLDDPERFVDATLADPLEGVVYGRGVAKIMRRDDGTPWIHSFAHGRTVYELKLDITAVRKTMQQAAPQATLSILVHSMANADLGDADLVELKHLVKTLSGTTLPIINAALKSAQQRQAVAAATNRRAYQAANRRDPRPLLLTPLPDQPWLPVVEALNEVIGVVVADAPPARDADADAVTVLKRAIPDTHAFESANPDGE